MVIAGPVRPIAIVCNENLASMEPRSGDRGNSWAQMVTMAAGDGLFTFALP